MSSAASRCSSCRGPVQTSGTVGRCRSCGRQSGTVGIGVDDLVNVGFTIGDLWKWYNEPPRPPPDPGDAAPPVSDQPPPDKKDGGDGGLIDDLNPIEISEPGEYCSWTDGVFCPSGYECVAGSCQPNGTTEQDLETDCKNSGGDWNPDSGICEDLPEPVNEGRATLGPAESTGVSPWWYAAGVAAAAAAVTGIVILLSSKKEAAANPQLKLGGASGYGTAMVRLHSESLPAPGPWKPAPKPLVEVPVIFRAGELYVHRFPETIKHPEYLSNLWVVATDRGGKYTEAKILFSEEQAIAYAEYFGLGEGSPTVGPAVDEMLAGTGAREARAVYVNAAEKWMERWRKAHPERRAKSKRKGK